MKTKFLFSFLFVSIISMGQTSSTHVQIKLTSGFHTEPGCNLQKIEELTLYLIQQELTIQELRKEVEQLKK